jgi:putative nucleotidyltransferase with HDIG domain
MKKRILFVDDEPLILEGLRRNLRGMRNEWEMEFASSGAEALDAMARSPSDVIITDMKMPGMNGAQLLNEVMRLYPHTARFIFSGQTEEELILKCVGTTHQCLAKPCDAESLKTAIDRTAPIDSLLANQALCKLVGGIQRLPTVPGLYSTVVRALQDPETPLQKIGRIIEQDPAMTAQLLRIVNSAFFGARRSMASASEAVLYLGIETTKTLLLSADLFSQFPEAHLREFNTSLWQHSLGVARAAKAFAQNAGASGITSDEAFAAGVLHDIGRLVMAANLPAYGEALKLGSEEKLPLIEVEVLVLGSTHSEVGAYLLRLWGLPLPIVEAVAFHHAPALSGSFQVAALTGVHAAEYLDNEHEHSPIPEHSDDGPDREYLRRVGCESSLAGMAKNRQD